MRVLFGVVGIAIVADLAHSISAGVFNMHGEPFRRADHPVGFWLYAAFVAGMGFVSLAAAAFGNRRAPEE